MLICVSNAGTQPEGDLRLPSGLHPSVKERGGAASLGLQRARLHAPTEETSTRASCSQGSSQKPRLVSFLWMLHGFPPPSLFKPGRVSHRYVCLVSFPLRIGAHIY